MKKIQAFLLLLGSNPIVAWLVRQVTTCGTAYLLAHPFEPAGWQSWAINGAIFILSGIVHAFDIWLQTQVANSPAPAAPSAPQVPTPVGPTSHLDKLRMSLKVGLVLLVFAACGSSFADELWTVSGKPFGYKAGMVSASLSDSSTGVHLVSMPTEALGFSVGGGTPSYGISGGYSLELTNVSSVNGQAKLSPLVGAGFDGYVDFGQFVNSGGSQPVKADLGFNVNGPDLSNFSSLDVVPQANITWNLQTGEKVFLVGPTAAFSSTFLDSLIVDFGRVF